LPYNALSKTEARRFEIMCFGTAKSLDQLQSLR